MEERIGAQVLRVFPDFVSTDWFIKDRCRQLRKKANPDDPDSVSLTAWMDHETRELVIEVLE